MSFQVLAGHEGFVFLADEVVEAHAGADVALPSESSGLLVEAGLEALARRAGPPRLRTVQCS